MMPELGKYALAVLSAYGAGIGLIVALVAVSLWQSGRVRRALRAAEARRGRADG